MRETYADHVILLADDDPDDRELIQYALKKTDRLHKIVTAEDGADCLDKVDEMIASHTLPCLIVLDLNMPKLDGKETFKILSAQAPLKTVPIVILSTSTNLQDIHFFEQRHIEYIIKPLKFDHFFTIAQRLLARCDASAESRSD